MKRRAPSAGSGFASPFHGSRARTPEPNEQCSLIGVLEALGSHQCALREKRFEGKFATQRARPLGGGCSPRHSPAGRGRAGQRQQPHRAGVGRRQGSLVCPWKTDEEPFPIPQVDRNRRQGSGWDHGWGADGSRGGTNGLGRQAREVAQGARREVSHRAVCPRPASPPREPESAESEPGRVRTGRI
jgi:hypothetical protein